MKRYRVPLVSCLAVLVSLVASNASAMPSRGDKVKSFKAIDITGRMVDLDRIMSATPRPKMVILFFFTTGGSADFAKRLERLHEKYGRQEVKIVAFGYKEQEAALKVFADKLNIEYYLLPSGQIDADALYGPIESLPLTYIINPVTKTIANIIQGSSETSALMLTKVAENFLMQGDAKAAQTTANLAQSEGENKKYAGTVKGSALLLEGKIDDAKKEFTQIGATGELAGIALQQGDTDKAIAIANQAAPNDGYADTIKGKALMRQGKLDQAAKVLDQAAEKPAMDFQKAETIIGQGRLEQEKGKLDDAIGAYDKALNLNSYSVTALSNEGAAYRQKGDLKKAVDVLERAKNLGGAKPDALVTMMLRQTLNEIKKANDTKRGELIRKQIADLQKRYQELKAAGTARPVDEWTSRPLVVAFLPAENEGPVFFERAGTALVLRREIEARVKQSGKVQVVERDVLDKLLQELNLGSSDIANPDTQLRLGKVLAAQLLGFIDFAQAGPDTVMYLRMVNSETTALVAQITENLKGATDLNKWVATISDELIKKIAGNRRLQGLIAQVNGNKVLINLGAKYGLKPGVRFAVLKDGETIEVGGRKLVGSPTEIATLEVTSVDNELSTCKVTDKSRGATIAKEMKIKELASK